MSTIGDIGDPAQRPMPQDKKRTADKQRNDTNIATPPSYLVFRPRPRDPQKTIVLTGAPRGGTSFAASIVAHLGVPFAGGREDAPLVGRRFSHKGLELPLLADDYLQFARVCDDIGRQRDVWAFKHPGFQFESKFARCLRNPHYIIILKEPLSVAMRSFAIRGRAIDGRPIAQSLKAIMKVYADQLDFCLGGECPVLLISYDRAIRDRKRTLRAVAEFLGIDHYDEAAVLSSIGGDREHYFEASTVNALRRSPDWRRRAVGRLLAYLRVQNE